MRKQGKIAYREKPPVRLILSTFGSSLQARRCARGLVRRRLAACCNVIPGLSSFFIWKGKAEVSREALLLVKTTGRRLPEALVYLKQRHPYELPELLVLSAQGGEARYLQWIIESCKK